MLVCVGMRFGGGWEVEVLSECCEGDVRVDNGRLLNCLVRCFWMAWVFCSKWV